ncbi:MAG: NAD(P)/FAD-dependent oxidoreductase [Beijerinckiaceae bacterium]|nr:MAG: NAD(P)/FAD-dependent oxidoreductase [Beijerinckiaceae bacterium]
MEKDLDRKKVVIAGGGFGGLSVAHALKGLPIDITLVDRQNHHCFQPLLYQVASAVVSPADIAWPIRNILRNQSNIRVVMADVLGVDVDAKLVKTDSVALSYDYLVLATGATHSYFGHDDWAKYAPGLKTISDATQIRARMLLAFEQAELATDEARRRALLTFVIVGGGPTGVEMAGAIAEVALQTLPHDFRDIDPRSARILLIEAGPRVLPSFPEALSAYAGETLRKLGVTVMTSSPVTECDGTGVTVNGERIEANTIIWGAGVVASPAAEWVGAAHDQAGRVKAEPDLSVPGHPDIFVIGDTAAVHDSKGRQVPGIAPAAKQMGKYVGKLIAGELAGKPRPAPFVYHHQGDLATIGTHSAVVNLDHLTLKGIIGWLFWSVAHIYFLIGIRNRFVVAISWIYGVFTSGRGARIITLPDNARSATRNNVR